MFREKEMLNPLYVVKLENDVILFVYDGYGKGSDGKIYKPVLENDSEDDCAVVGWERECD